MPSSDKERKRKNDKRDARKLSRELEDGSLRAIYVHSVEMEQARALVRQRHRLVQDRTRCKNRIKHLLMFNSLELSTGKQRWSNKYVKTLEAIECGTPALRETLKSRPGTIQANKPSF